MTAHHVYRCYDGTGRLVYVGSSRDLFGRLATHEAKAFWATEVTKVVAQVYPSKEKALAVERRAIRTENPRFNVKGRWPSHLRWTVADYDDYLLALLARPNTDQKAGHIARVREHRALAAGRAA